MNDCRDLEVLLSLRAAGALEPDEARRVEAHLSGCAACRAAAEESEEALRLAKLPPPSAAELGLLRDLPARTLDALRGAARRRGFAKRVAAGIALAAAAILLVLAPAVLRRPASPAPARTAERWQEPDVDELWADAALIEDDYSADAGGDETDAALAALEYVKGEAR